MNENPSSPLPPTPGSGTQPVKWVGPLGLIPLLSYALNGLLLLALLVSLIVGRHRLPHAGGHFGDARAEEGFIRGFAAARAVERMGMDGSSFFDPRPFGTMRGPEGERRPSFEAAADFDRPPGPEGRGHDPMERAHLLRPAPQHRADRQLEHLTTDLTLTDAQKEKIKPLLLAREQQVEKLLADLRQALDRARTESEAKIKALLTPEQQKLLPMPPVERGQEPASPDAP